MGFRPDACEASVDEWLTRRLRFACHVVRGSGHWLMEEAPDQVIPALVKFLNN